MINMEHFGINKIFWILYLFININYEQKKKLWNVLYAHDDAHFISSIKRAFRWIRNQLIIITTKISMATQKSAEFVEVLRWNKTKFINKDNVENNNFYLCFEMYTFIVIFKTIILLQTIFWALFLNFATINIKISNFFDFEHRNSRNIYVLFKKQHQWIWYFAFAYISSFFYRNKLQIKWISSFFMAKICF